MGESMTLPAGFLSRMRSLLGGEYEDFLACYEQPAKKGIRINTLKAEAEAVTRLLDCQRSPFSPLSFYITEKVGAMPLHAAGAFYAQEPSASSAVTVLDPRPGDRVLDVCAAPGGKSTQIAALLQNEGLLWSNEPVKSRANILLSNIERMGIRNAVVSSVYPDVLEKGLKGYFDKVLVDAPCSGEGMFRKNPEAVGEWSPRHVEACAGRQLAILNSAASCLKAGGVLVYSTCTFSVEENEGTVKKFLEENPGFSQEKIEVPFGRPGLDGKSLRIFPMDGGEGHFMARFARTAGGGDGSLKARGNSRAQSLKSGPAADLYAELFNTSVFGPIEAMGDKFLILPRELPELRGLGVIRAGVMLGEAAGKRIEPHHALFMAHSAKECRRALNLANGEAALAKFLHGEEIDCAEKGYAAVAVEGITLGFGKASGGKLKNKYPKGLRI